MSIAMVARMNECCTASDVQSSHSVHPNAHMPQLEDLL